MDTCDYKPYSRLQQVAKDNKSQKTPHGMYSHTDNHISLVVTYTILGNILKIIEFK